MKIHHLDCILIALLFVNTVAVLRTVPLENLQRTKKTVLMIKIKIIKEHIETYRQARGYYPQTLEDIPDLDRIFLRDPWGIQLEYNPSDDKSGLILRSVGYKKSLAQNKIRSIYHLIANACLAVLTLLILYVRTHKDGYWPTIQSLPLLLSLGIGLFLRLGGEGALPPIPVIVSDFYAGLLFHTFLITVSFLVVISLNVVIHKLDTLNIATLVVALYAMVSVFLLLN